MTDNAKRYLALFQESYLRSDEISLGFSLGFAEFTTLAILRELMALGKVEFSLFGICAYRPVLLEQQTALGVR